MSREQERIRRKLEKNPVMECNKVRKKYCPNLFQDFTGTKDPRHLSYTEYSNRELLGTMFYKGIESMHAMTYEFNQERVVENLFRFMEEKGKEYLPHSVTINEYFERLDPYELQKVQQKQVYGLPIILLADSLYASEPVMDICRGNSWKFIIRYKTGSIPSIAEEYERIPEKETSGHAEFINDIDYNGKLVNMLRYFEEKTVKGETVRTEFQWLTSIRITKKNAEKIAETGRKRWKIENEGFNRQKNWQGDITHACSHNANALIQ